MSTCWVLRSRTISRGGVVAKAPAAFSCNSRSTRLGTNKNQRQDKGVRLFDIIEMIILARKAKLANNNLPRSNVVSQNCSSLAPTFSVGLVKQNMFRLVFMALV